jgi:hypothetical protein
LRYRRADAFFELSLTRTLARKALHSSYLKIGTGPDDLG